MAERSLQRRLLTFPRPPVIARAAALVALVGVVTALGVFLWSRRAPVPPKPEEPVLGGEVTAIFQNFSHLETEAGKDKYLLTADTDRAFSNGAHELANVKLLVFGADGKGTDRIVSESATYSQDVALVVFEKNVKIESADGLTVETDRVRFNQETHVVDMLGPVKYKRPNLEGVCRDATVEMDQGRLFMHHDVDMTFKSTDEKPKDLTAASITGEASVAGPSDTQPAAPAQGGKKGKKKGGGGGHGGGHGGGGKKKKAKLAAQAAGGGGGGPKPAVDFSHGPKIPVRIQSASAMFDRTALTAKYEGGAVVTREQDELRGATLVGYLTDETRFKKVESRGDAFLRANGKAEASAPSIDFLFADANQLQSAIATGGARMVSLGDPPIRTVTGDRIDIDFAPGATGSELHQARVNGQAVVTVDAPPATAAAPNPSSRELKADVIVLDMLAGGQFAESADATGNAVLTITPSKPGPRVDRRRISAEHMRMDFFEEKNLARAFTATGGVRTETEPTVNDGRAVRVTTSNVANATFNRETQDINRMEQTGEFKYVEGERNATSNSAVYTALDDTLVLHGPSQNGRPTIWDSKGRSQADDIEIRPNAQTSTGRGDVRTTYYSQESTGGATPFGKTKSPVFLTAQRVDARQADGGVAVYTGNARAWQDDSYVKGDKITLFHDDRRTVVEGSVESGLYKATAKDAKGADTTVPIFTTASQMTYSDPQRMAHYEGSVVSRQAPQELKSDVQDVWLTQGEQSTVDHLIATGNVFMSEPGRKANGQKLVYTASDQKAVLTGSNARVDDAAQGTTTGEELTFYVGGERIRATGRPGAGRVKSTHRVASGGSQE